LYRFGRHPGYLRERIIVIATSLTLGSFWGLKPAFIAISMLFVRTYLKDMTLQKELLG
jgi:protein-S-isoprenylcysteine O-methyltransferase Ste14